MNQLNSETVKRLAKEVGFDLCGITTPEPIPQSSERFRRWLDRGYHDQMTYLARDPERRSDPRVLMPSVQSVVVLGLNYYQPNSQVTPKSSGRVARFARGKDYHKVIERMGMQFVAMLSQVLGPGAGAEFRFLVDYGPMLERAIAAKAGLGFIGKNSMLISRQFGSWFFLAELLTSLPLESDDPFAVNHGRCGTCNLCIEACPTGAIVDDYTIDSRKCLSYLTIEKPSEIDSKMASQLGDTVFGCDICQEVCPHNCRAVLTEHSELLPESGVGEFIDIDEVLKLTSQEEFLQFTAGTSLTRPKLEGLQRCARIVRNNQAE
ncbi:MAG: tRNA epoxyqueuosine(34) reductase QueG [Candidatus Zixiibacteriota bacterium]|nr:MAG: tRNA epoxyqueuosine(34) reductase QueG [candidate division Zixibacteria bacterium]